MTTAIKTQFEFHKVGKKFTDGKEIAGWWLYITDRKQLNRWLHYNARDMVQIWKDIKDSPNFKEGHCRTIRAGMFKSALWCEMEKRVKANDTDGSEEFKMSMPDCLNFLEYFSTKSAIDIFDKNGLVYVNRKGACRHTTLNIAKLEEGILGTYKTKKLVFPILTKNDVKISKWQGGNHFYLQVNGCSVSVKNGNGWEHNWKTIEAVEKARTRYIRNCRRRIKKN